MLARASNSLDHLTKIVRDICELDFSEQDGVVFDSHTIDGEVMQTQREYAGIRVRFRGRLGNSKIPMQLDIGFGDVITPAPQEMVYPVLLDLPAPRLRGYPPETVVAEKLQTMVEKGLLNSRVKDYYDVWILSRWRKLDPVILKDAVIRTFEQRRSQLNLVALTQLLHEYGGSKERQQLWKRFRLKNILPGTAPESLAEICVDLAGFVHQELAAKE